MKFRLNVKTGQLKQCIRSESLWQQPKSLNHFGMNGSYLFIYLYFFAGSSEWNTGLSEGLRLFGCFLFYNLALHACQTSTRRLARAAVSPWAPALVDPGCIVNLRVRFRAAGSVKARLTASDLRRWQSSGDKK